MPWFNKTSRLRNIFLSASALGMAASLPASAHVNDQPASYSTVIAMNKKGEKSRMSGLRVEQRSCLRLDRFLSDRNAYKNAPSFDALDKLYKSSQFTRHMMRAAANQNVEVCDMRLSEHIGGVHIPELNKIGLDFKNGQSSIENMIYLTHEFSHYMQELNGTEYFDANRNLNENQRVILAMEAAAYTAEMLFVHKAQAEGTISSRSPFEAGSDRGRRYTDFKREYRNAKRAGMDEQAATNQAARKTWAEVMTDRKTLDLYNANLIAFTLSNVKKIEPHIAGNYRDPNLNSTIRKAGQLGAGIDFAHHRYMPVGDAAFGGNNRMQKIFEAVEWYRESRIWPGSEYISAKQTYLAAKGNSYVYADFNAAARNILAGRDVERSITRAAKSFDWMPATHNWGTQITFVNTRCTFQMPG